MARKSQEQPLGVDFKGRTDQVLPFKDPYRWIGELNQIERWKLDRHPLDVADAVINIYAKGGGPAAIAKVPGEVERLKWVGLYPQRQGGDAYMLRIKVPGGVLTAEQAREIGVVAEAFGHGPDDSPVFGNRYADITTRQDIQIHWIRMSDVPRIWERFADVGLTTVQACGDSARNVLGCPVAGVDADEVFNALPIAQAISDFFTGNREYANLPRKFKMSATGCLDDCAQAEINDIGLWPARAEDGTLGFNLLVGGGLSDGERMASDIDVFVGQEEAVEICRAIAQTFGELGNRENRGLARMRYLVQELGPERFRAELAARTRFKLAPAGETLTRRYRGDHVGVHRQKGETASGEPLFYVGCSVPVGRLTGLELTEVARLAETYGDGTVRLGTDQNFVLTGVPESRVDALSAERLLAKYSPNPGPFERGVVACTGTEFCRFAIVETKERAVKWARFLDSQLAGERVVTDLVAPESPHSTGKAAGGSTGISGSAPDAGVIRMHFSGCSASCAQPQIADIGFRGATAHVDNRLVEAVDIGLGGSLGQDAAFIDWIDSGKPVDEVPEALLRVVRRYQEERREGEAFFEWSRRVPNDVLRGVLSGTGEAVPVSLAPSRGRKGPQVADVDAGSNGLLDAGAPARSSAKGATNNVAVSTGEVSTGEVSTAAVSTGDGGGS